MGRSAASLLAVSIGVLGATAALLLAPSPSVAAPGAGSPSVERVDVGSPPRIRFFLNELDGSLKVPAGLPEPAGVRIKVDGQAQADAPPRIETFAGAGEALALTLVVELGPTMDEVLADLKSGLGDLVASLPPGSKIGVVGYADVVTVDKAPSGANEAKQTIESLSIHSDALELRLVDAVAAALARLKGPAAADLPKRRVILVISVGLSASRPVDFTRLGGDASADKVRIHAIGYFGMTDDGQPTLAALSKSSRGTLRGAKNKVELDTALKALGGELRLQRVIDYDLPQLFDGKRHEFVLEVPSGATDVVRVDVPESEVARSTGWKGVFLGVVLVLGLAGVIGGGLLMARRSKAGAKARLEQQLQPASVEAQAPADFGKTAYGLRAPLKPKDGKIEVSQPPADRDPEDTANEGDTVPPSAWNPPAKGPSAKRQVDKPSVKPIEPPLEPRPRDDDEMPTLLRGLRSPLAPDPEVAPTPEEPRMGAVSPLIPSPTQFFRNISQEQPAPVVVTNRDAPEAPIPGLRLRPDSGAAIPNDKTDPAPSPVSVPSRPASGPGSEARSAPSPAPEPGLLVRKTMVFDPRDIEKSDSAAWIVRVGPNPETIVLSSTIDLPGQVRFELDGLGRWVLVEGDRRRVMSDGGMFEAGGETYVYKIASRFTKEAVVSRPFLQVVGGLDDGNQVLLEEQLPRILGASPGVDEIIRGKGVAGRHVVVRLEGQRCKVADLGSETGLKVNGEAVGVADLASGEEVLVGAVRLVFQVPR